MLIKGIIKKITQTENGVDFDIRLPIFETAGSDEEFIETGKLCYQPGNINGYEVDDIVYVTFENNKYEQPVILGKLYKGNEKSLFQASLSESQDDTTLAKKNASTFSYSGDLEVVDKAILPTDTMIGNISYSDLVYLIKRVEYLEEAIQDIDTTETIMTLTDYSTDPPTIIKGSKVDITDYINGSGTETTGDSIDIEDLTE